MKRRQDYSSAAAARPITFSLAVTLIPVMLLVLASAAAEAATFNIADGDVAGLKSAITTANSNNEDDTIDLATKH